MFRVVENQLGPVLESVSVNSMQKGLAVEREATKRNAAINGNDITTIDGKVGISVASDTHWPRRGGGGKKYVSPSGLTYMIGCLSGMIVACHICSQDCRVCSYFEREKRKATWNLMQRYALTGVLEIFRNPKVQKLWKHILLF